MKLILQDAPEELIEYIQPKLVENLESTSVSGVDFQYDDTATGRWNQLVLAGQGSRLWSDKENKNSPLYAGPLPKNSKEADLVVADLLYTQSRLDRFLSYRVTYIGRVALDPRNILVIDHKKASERQDVHLSEALSAVLSASPKDWWGSLGIASSGNADALEGFLSSMPDVIPLAYSEGASAKLRYANREFVSLEKPEPVLTYGMNMRGSANDLSRKLAIQESAKTQ